MKAIVSTGYGSADVLKLREVEKPVPMDDKVLIRVHAAGVTAAHCAMREGPLFARPMTGLFRPRNPIPGTDLAGEVEAVGKDVTRFNVGDRVFGGTALGFGCYAEYICLPEGDMLATMPDGLTFEEATAVVDGAVTALPFLRDAGKIRAGHKVLINGASGGVGTAAVQLARHFGAEVTGVCSTRNLELVKSLGADNVVDYTKEDFTKNGERYDIIFDTVGKSSFARCKDSLNENGVYLSTVISLPVLLSVLRTSMSGRKKAILMLTGMRQPDEKAADLQFIKELIENGRFQSVIDRCYPLDEAAEAQRYVEKGHKRGNVVLAIANNGRL